MPDLALSGSPVHDTLVDSGSPAVDLAADAESARLTRLVLEVDLLAIRHNLELARRLAGGAEVMAVLKGDAYGLGAKAVGSYLDAAGVTAFAVDSVAEGLELREEGITRPILVFDGEVPENAALAVANGLLPAIGHESLLEAYEAAAAEAAAPYAIWLVANVGFNRSGYRDLSLFTRFALRVRECGNLVVRGVYAQLTSAGGDRATNLEQIAAFARIAGRAREIFGPRLQTSLFASHGLLRFGDELKTEWVRPGLMLYGVHCFEEDRVEPEALAVAAELQPALRLRARVTHVLRFDREEGVGYGQRYRTRPGQRVATVAAGFGCGYPAVGASCRALARGRSVPVFGDVGMDALQLDVTHVPELGPYEWVTLVGRDDGLEVPPAELARAAGSTPYRLLRGLRAQKRYIGEKGDPS